MSDNIMSAVNSNIIRCNAEQYIVVKFSADNFSCMQINVVQGSAVKYSAGRYIEVQYSES